MFLFFAFFAANIANINSNNIPPNASAEFIALGNEVSTSNLLYIAVTFGTSITVMIFIWKDVSGGLFNPAVSFGLWLIGKLTFRRMVLLFITQIIAGITASAMVLGLVNKGLYIRCTLGGGINVAQGFFIEMFFTAQLVLTVIMMAIEKHENNHLAPVAIGLSIFIAHIGSIYYTGTGINPARAFGPNVVLGQFNRYDWIYWIAPLVGAALAAGVWAFLKLARYREVKQGDTGVLANDENLRNEYKADLESGPASEKTEGVNVTPTAASTDGVHNSADPMSHQIQANPAVVTTSHA